jgi:hypothetical protein
MRRFIAIIGLWAVLALGSFGLVCSTQACTPPSTTPIVNTLPALGACIIQAAGGDFVDALNDPATLIPAIISQCLQYGAATAQAIMAYLESWFADSPVTDAGAASAQSPAAIVRARQMKVHAAALAYQGIVVTFSEAGSQ